MGYSLVAGKKSLLEAERQELLRALDMGKKQQELFNALFHIDEQLDNAAHESAKRIAQLQQKMVLLQKKIQEIETPRDDSFDNMYASLFFSTSSGEFPPSLYHLTKRLQDRAVGFGSLCPEQPGTEEHEIRGPV